MITSAAAIADTVRTSMQAKLWETFFVGNATFENKLMGSMPTQLTDIDPKAFSDLGIVQKSTLGDMGKQNNLFIQKTQDLSKAAFELATAGKIINAFA